MRNLKRDAPRLHAEYRDRFGEFIPWPYRDDDDPIPLFCPKCARRLLVNRWDNYVDLWCAGRLSPILAILNRVLPTTGHWVFSLAKLDRTAEQGPFDPATGLPTSQDSTFSGPVH